MTDPLPPPPPPCVAAEVSLNDVRPHRSRSLPRRPESAKTARALVTSSLRAWGLDAAMDSAHLVVTELVSNAVRHAEKDTLLVTVTRQDAGLVRIAVVDLSEAPPVMRCAAPDAVDGRGLALMSVLSDGRWGVEPMRWGRRTGKRVWVDINVPEPPAPVLTTHPQPVGEAMDATTWDRIGLIRQWLDDEAPQAGGGDRRLLRVLKISEEVGEVAEALHGALGANPRKGASHTWDDVRKELVDVAVTTLVALATLSEEPEKLFDERLRQLVGRVAGPSGEGV